MSGPASYRTRFAVVATRAVSAVSQRMGIGSGSVAGGNVGLWLDPGLLSHLGRGRRVAVVSGTNGKTTTTRLLAVAIQDALGLGATNATGSNMPAGLVTALASAARSAAAVLEVDEGYVPGVVKDARPEVVVLLNLSRDQLDRTNEVRMVAHRWHQALSDAPFVTAVANADDPLVVWGASAAARQVWVAAGLSWRSDAVGCPACDGRIDFSGENGWACPCGFARPSLDVAVQEDDQGCTVAAFADGRRLAVELAIPGRFNRANAVMAAAGAEVLGVPASVALGRMARVQELAGRVTTLDVEGTAVRLMLAKNPAGWRELLELVCPGTSPLTVGINARVADGRDPSWLWDVPFERLRGRLVVATGERCRDLAVRLRYADVAHRVCRDPIEALRLAKTCAEDSERGRDAVGNLDFIGNYTAFTDVRGRVGRRRGPGGQRQWRHWRQTRGTA